MIIEIPYLPGSLSTELKEEVKSEFLSNENKIVNFIPLEYERLNQISLIKNRPEFFIQTAQNYFTQKTDGYAIAALLKNINEGLTSPETLLMVKTENFGLYPWLKKNDNRSKYGTIYGLEAKYEHYK